MIRAIISFLGGALMRKAEWFLPFILVSSF